MCVQAGYTALHDAAQYGRTAVVKQLLWHGAMRAVEGKDGRTPHDLATGGEGVDSAGVVALLNGVPQQLRQAAFEGQYDKTLALLQSPGVTVNDEDEVSEKALANALPQICACVCVCVHHTCS